MRVEDMAILAPPVFVYVEDAKQIQARGDVRQIATAVQTMYKDTRRWRPGNADLLEWADVGILTSNGFDLTTGAVAHRLTGSNAWKGPYLDQIPDSDSWAGAIS